MALSCIISEIKRYVGQESRIFSYPTCIRRPSETVSCLCCDCAITQHRKLTTFSLRRSYDKYCRSCWSAASLTNPTTRCEILNGMLSKTDRQPQLSRPHGTNIIVTSSSAVAKRPRDASCLSVVSFNSMKRRVESFIVSYC